MKKTPPSKSASPKGPAKSAKPAKSLVGKAPATSKLIPGSRRVMLFLDVPFDQNVAAKNLGAKWDPAMRKWYVPHGVDIHLFTRWWPATLKQEMKGFGQL